MLGQGAAGALVRERLSRKTHVILRERWKWEVDAVGTGLLKRLKLLKRRHAGREVGVEGARWEVGETRRKTHSRLSSRQETWT